ncbi:MAG: hypothetical protein U1E05_18185 [Patescibacteria group bacterium]|nr:hypothetical protein [Patescibacteria group bacterium]
MNWRNEAILARGGPSGIPNTNRRCRHEDPCFVLAFWDCTDHPENTNATTPARFTLTGVTFDEPVWVDMVTGAIYELPQERVKTEGDATVLSDIPVYDAPALITDRSTVLPPS